MQNLLGSNNKTQRKGYAYASFFADQNLGAANLATYWNLSNTWQAIVFYFLVPFSLLVINFAPVSVSIQREIEYLALTAM